jgi:hypothetical protein
MLPHVGEGENPAAKAALAEAALLAFLLPGPHVALAVFLQLQLVLLVGVEADNEKAVEKLLSANGTPARMKDVDIYLYTPYKFLTAMRIVHSAKQVNVACLDYFISVVDLVHFGHSPNLTT